MGEQLKPVIHETDVLVIGAGFSGGWAALRAAQTGARVLVVDKGPRDWGGLGMMSGGDMITLQPEYNIDELVDELVYYFDGLCDQNQLRMILEHSYERFRDLESWGHVFARDTDGKLLSVPQRGLKHMRMYVYHPYGKGGVHTTETLQDQMRRLGVRRVSQVEVTDLVKQDGKVCGAAGFHIRGGAPHVFRAKAVVLATFSGGWKASYLSNTCAGEGVALGFQAGAAFRNMEFMGVWNVPMMFAWEGQTGMLPFGARFLNAGDEDFMRRYSPRMGAKVDPHYNVRGMALEARAGRSPIRFDTSTMTPEGVRAMTPSGGWMKLNADKLKARGIDFFNEPTIWMPQFNKTFGGMAATLDGFTGVPGLYAAGRALSVNPGVYMGGWDTCVTSTTGYIAGESAARYASGICRMETDVPHALDLVGKTTALMGGTGYAPKDVVRLMQELLSSVEVVILKTGRALSDALDKLDDIKRNIIPAMSASEPHYLMKLVEARSMALVTEMYLRASLARKESRCGHFREDYPRRDGNPAWIMLSSRNGEIAASFRPVPLEDYPVRPYRYYMDEFNFPNVITPESDH